MKKYVVTPTEMRRLDQELIRECYDSSFDLMHYAGSLVANDLLKNSLIQPEERTVILAGPGNNGGDALVIAEILHNKNYAIEVLLLSDFTSCSNETKQQITKLKKLSIEVNRVTERNINTYLDDILDADHVIDGIFGIGLTRSLSTFLKTIIHTVNESKCKVFSVDIPSGLNALNGCVMDLAIKADLTYVIGAYKIGNLLEDAKDHHGEIRFIDIGIKGSSNKLYITEKDVNEPSKDLENIHKYSKGHVLVVGGSLGMMGAPALTSLASLRYGAGLVSLAVHRSLVDQTRNLPLEIMTPQYETATDVLRMTSKIGCIAYGMGLGVNIDKGILNELINLDVPMVIDADGLKEFKPLLNKNYSNIVITPHHGELANLLSITVEELKSDPVKYVEELSKSKGLTVLLKGPTTILSDGEDTFFSNFGSNKLATAGSGDILTGIVSTKLLLPGKVINNVQSAVFIHAKSAEKTVFDNKYIQTIASDLLK